MDQPVTIRMPGAVIEFSNITHKSGALDTICTVWRDCPTDPLLASAWEADRMFRYHLSARSLSNVTAFRRELDKFHGDDLDWTRLLHDAIRQAEVELVGRISSVDPWPEPGAPARSDLISGVLVENEVNCVFGMGGSGKSLAVQSMTLATSGSGPWAGRHVNRPINTLWLDYENPTPDTFAAWRSGLMAGGITTTPGSLRWMSGAGVPLQDLLERLSKEMQRFSCTHLVIDSIAFACGGDPLKAEVATAFYGAIAKLGAITTTLIAHTDKAENDKYPFGSIFWHNGIHGMSWMIKHTPGQGHVNVGFYNRKATKGPRPQDFAIKFTFEDVGEEEVTRFTDEAHEEARAATLFTEDEAEAAEGPPPGAPGAPGAGGAADAGGFGSGGYSVPAIWLTSGDLRAVSRATGAGSASDRIADALASGGKLTARELAEVLGVSDSLARARLGDMAGRGRVAKDDTGRWYLPYEA